MGYREFICTECQENTCTLDPSLTCCDDCLRTCQRCDARVPSLLDCGDIDICQDCEDDTGWHRKERRAQAAFNGREAYLDACKEAYIGVGR